MAADASSSFAIPPQEKYDVFVSFRGEDTRNTFTSHLHAALLRKKFETYIDYRLERGDEIAPALLEAIQKSKLSLIIFSKNYASSTWCLDELVHILGCKERDGQFVIPIFHDIDPSHVRKQQGNYAHAFVQLEERYGIDKVDKWRHALNKAANLSGFDNSNKTRTDADLVENVVEDIWTKLKRKSSSDLKGLVGIESRIEKIESLLCIGSLDVCSVGIWGMGGIGKTTLADAVFHRLSPEFEACCFLANVREKSEEKDGLIHLRSTLLREILKEKDLNIDTPSIGSTFVKERLSRIKVLIVLDDVSHSSQIELLAGDQVQFGPGSRIMVTTRDRRVLKIMVDDDDDKIYEVEGLKHDEALQLFHLNGFKNNSLQTDYTELLGMVVDYAEGMPLALKILGSSLLHCKSKEEWEEELNKLKKFPSGKIQNVLRLSYDGLEENEKEIFLDIACFYKGEDMDYVKRMLDIRGLFAAGIRVLIDMSLISISTWNFIEMHDLLQEMGREIVRKQCIEEPGKRNRLCIAEDVYHVLKNNTGTATVQAIFFNGSKNGELHLNRADFENMYNLRLLSVVSSFFGEHFKLNVSVDLPNSLSYILWEEYPLKSLQSKFSPENLVELHMPDSQLEQLLNEGQNLMNLKVINLRFSRHLTEVPNLSHSLKIEHIDLFGCESLVEIPFDLQSLDKLTYLELGCCTNLKSIPDMPGNIEVLDLFGTAIKELPSSIWSHEKISDFNIRYCKNLKNLPSSSCKLRVSGTFSLEGCSSLGEFTELPRDIKLLDLTGTGIEVFPSSSKCLFDLATIKLNHCKRLASLPMSICNLKSLETLDLTGCSKFENFPEILEPMEHLEFLSVKETAVKELPSSIECLYGLNKLQLKDCKRLVSLPTSICKLKSLETLDLTGCSNFEYFPEILEPMEHMKFLSLDGTVVKELPPSIGNLIGLQTLTLLLCKNLEVVPNSIYNLTNLKTLSFYACWKLKQLPPVSFGLVSLEALNLSYSGILKIPDGLICLPSLRYVDVRGTKIESVPASIKQACQLSRLYLTNCESLQSLPELPVLCYLEAYGCTSLKTVSRTAPTQGWDKRESFRGHLNFSNCLNLDQTAWSNIMDDAQLRIMWMATAPSKFREDENYEIFDPSLVSIACPGNEVPNWFSFQNEGSSINMKLPPNWFDTDFLGFALSVVVSFDCCNVQEGLKFGCKYNFKTNNGESYEINCPYYIPCLDGESYYYLLDSDHVFVLYNAFELVEGSNLKCSTAFYQLVTEVSIDVYQVDVLNGPLDYLSPTVKKCGICLLYGEDAEIMLGRRGTKRHRDESEATSGSKN